MDTRAWASGTACAALAILLASCSTIVTHARDLERERVARKPIALADDETQKARVNLSYVDCDGDITIRNGRLGLYLGGRFVADTILGATYVGAIYVWGGEDKRYTLLFSEDFSQATLSSARGGAVHAKCYRSP